MLTLESTEAIRWHLRNHNCKQIVLGGSHDGGYGTFLDDVLRDDASRQRVTIMEGIPSPRSLLDTKLNILNLNEELLCRDKLIDPRRLSDSVPRGMPATITPPATVAGMSPLPPPPTTPSSATSSAPNGAPLSYATAIKAATPPPQVTLPLPSKLAKQQSVVRREKPQPWNPGVRGLDPPLEVNQSALDNIKKRKDNNKLCNNHYLRGPCAKGDVCCFEHKYKPNEAEKTAIAFLARLNPCTSGQDCEVDDCIYGHHASAFRALDGITFSVCINELTCLKPPQCPSTRDGQCMHPYCKFKPWEHPPNTKYRQTYPWADEV